MSSTAGKQTSNMSGEEANSAEETRVVQEKKVNDLTLCYGYPVTTDTTVKQATVVGVINENPRRGLHKRGTLTEDGLYACESPFTYNVVKPYQLDDLQALEYQRRRAFVGKLLEIAIRDVTIHTGSNSSGSSIEISSVAILFKRKVICKTGRPFNRKLYKLLIRNSECDNLSIEVRSQDGQSSVLPLPLPKRNVKDSKIDIEFAIRDALGRIYAGTVTCTVSISQYGHREREEHSAYIYKLSNDPNDPQNSLSLLRPKKSVHKEDVKYLLLADPALRFDVEPDQNLPQRVQRDEIKPPDIVVTEQPAFSLLDISLRDLLQARRPLRPSSSTRRHHTVGKSTLTVVVLRGVEIPLREESASVQPLVEVEWGGSVQATFVADGPAPIWQHTMQFELPRQNGEQCVRLRLYDQHPVWGQQWLGEARIPFEYHRNYQELERWITLSPLFSPVLLFGYVQASPGQAQTRIYVLMKLEQPGTVKSSIESTAVNTLLKGIQRCVAIPYKVAGLEQPEEAARLTMLLPSLPIHYGPVTPRQALNIKKVDHYGRAALLASLLQGFDLQAYVLLGSSQISKWSAFVLTLGENDDHVLWDPEIGHCYRLGDNRCSLMKVSRLINHSGIWENLQKSILPHNLKYDTRSIKDWRSFESTVPGNRSVQTIELNVSEEDQKRIKEACTEIEQNLRDKLSDWRSTDGLTTIFNRHAVNVLRKFISKAATGPNHQLDKRDLKKLYRSYHTHGFVMNTRQFNTSELVEQLKATKVHKISGPIEFALVYRTQQFVGQICSSWLSVIVLRNRG